MSQRIRRRITTAVIIAAVLAVSIVCCGANKSGQAEPECIVYTRTIEEYEVEFGDSISAIAAKFCPIGIDFYEYQRDLKKLNNCGNNIYAGDIIKVYVYEK